MFANPFKNATILLLFTLVGTAHAQEDMDQIQTVLENSAPAIAKIIVRGSAPSAGSVIREGTGFFIYSGNGSSLLVTAAHLIGSSENDQTKNDDWKVENGKIDRRIEVLSLDEHHSLLSRTTDVQVVPASFGPGVDLALLMIYQDGFKTLLIANSLTEKPVPHSVMLLGFPERSTSLPRPPKTGVGQLASPSLFSISGSASQQGESGGPWIDVRWGTVYAVARGLGAKGGETSIEGTPIQLLLPALVGKVPREQWLAWQEAALFRSAYGDISKLRSYINSCQICAYKELAESEIASLEAREERAHLRHDEEEAYRAARGSEEQLKHYIANCKICEFKAAASAEVASLEVQRQQIVAREKELSDYKAAQGDVEKLEQYRSTCAICEYKAAAASDIASIKQQRELSEAAQQEAGVYKNAHGNIDNLKNYVETCNVCEFKAAALSEIASLDDQLRRAQAEQTEAALYKEAKGNVQKLTGYVSSCNICEFKAATLNEIASLNQQQRRLEISDREVKLYQDARGNEEKLKSYVQTCNVCEFKATAQAEILSLARQTCDRTMAAQFDLDLPASAPFVADTSSLSSADVDRAISDCLTAYKETGNRRYGTQAARAYAARAKASASAGKEAAAREDMQQAVRQWEKAAADGSGAAWNFLGAYFLGSFNTNAVTFISPDYSEALKKFLKGSDLGNAKAMRNAGAMLVQGAETFPPVVRDVSRGRPLLEAAMRLGEASAATELGKDLFYGWPSELGKDVARGLELLSKACAAKDRGASEFFEKEFNRDKFKTLLPEKVPEGCQVTTEVSTETTTTNSQPIATVTYWNLNESVMSLVTEGSNRKLSYFTPRPGLASVGVKEGTLFFEGNRSGNTYTGYAYVFSKYCGAAAYAVTGTLSADQRQITLSGKTPRRNATCQVVDYSGEPSILSRRDSN